jgi:hypothetical protein
VTRQYTTELVASEFDRTCDVDCVIVASGPSSPQHERLPCRESCGAGADNNAVIFHGPTSAPCGSSRQIAGVLESLSKIKEYSGFLATPLKCVQFLGVP